MPGTKGCLQCHCDTGTPYRVFPGTTDKQEGRLTVRLKTPPLTALVCDNCLKAQEKSMAQEFTRRLILGLGVLGIYLGALFTSSLTTIPAVLLGILIMGGILYLRVEAISIKSKEKQINRILTKHRDRFITGEYTSLFLDYQVDHMRKNNINIIEE